MAMARQYPRVGCTQPLGPAVEGATGAHGEPNGSMCLGGYVGLISRQPLRIIRCMQGKRNQVRIIGGRWRGRKVSFPDVAGLRPTSDRVRETVFNWLQPVIAGARCLDLFAGSGAFGFEAASRGASRVLMIDRDARVAAGLNQLCVRLDATEIEVRCQDALTFLDGKPEPFDILFLDPPFRSGLLSPVVGRILDGGWLAPMGRVYVESDDENTLRGLDRRLRVERLKRAGNVWFGLLSDVQE